MKADEARNSLVDDLQEVLRRTDEHINNFLSGKVEKTGATTIAKDIVKHTGLKAGFVNPLVSLYIARRDDVESKKGCHGGLRKTKV